MHLETLNPEDIVCYIDDAERRVVLGCVSETGVIDDSTGGPKVLVDWIPLISGETYNPETHPFSGLLRNDEVQIWKRDLWPGCLVRHAADDRFGVVLTRRHRAFVKLLSYDHAMFAVDCSRLRSIVNKQVIWGGWLGRQLSVHCLAIVRFEDGSRLLVRGSSLRAFKPVAPTDATFNGPVIEGVWLRGYARDLKAKTARKRQAKHVEAIRQNVTGSTLGCSEPEYSSTDGFPSRLRDQLLQYPIAREFVNQPGGLNRCMERLPLLLQETELRTAAWLSALSEDSSQVDVLVECMVPFEARVRWLTSSNPTASPPPFWVRGDDVAKLTPIEPSIYLSPVAGNVCYLQLDESDVLYSLKPYHSPEALLYDWVRQRQSQLDSVSLPMATKLKDPVASAAPVSKAAGVMTQDPDAGLSDRSLRVRQSYLPPLRPGSCVAVGIYSIQAEHDVRWLDGSVGRSLNSKDLLWVPPHLANHRLFPGVCVSMKTGPSNEQASTVEANTAPVPRDYGFVLSSSLSDRTCVVQWFRRERSPGQKCPDLVPVGQPETCRPFDLQVPEENQVPVQFRIWVTPREGEDPDNSVGLAVDPMVEPGKVAVEWTNGARSVICQTRCLVNVEEVAYSESWFSDDQEDFDVADSFTAMDVSVGDDNEQDATSGTPATAKMSDRSGQPTGDHGQIPSAKDESTRKTLRDAAEWIGPPCQSVESVRRLFENHQLFASALIQGRVPVLPRMDERSFQFSLLFSAAAMAIAPPLDRPENQPTASLLCSSSGDRLVGQLFAPSAPLLDGKMLENLHHIRDTLRSLRNRVKSAYDRSHDPRVRTLHEQCDIGHWLRNECVEDIVKSIRCAMSDEVRTPRSAECGQSGGVETVDVRHASLDAEMPLAVSEPSVLTTELLETLGSASLKVLVLPEASRPDWNHRIRYCLSLDQRDAYMVVGGPLFNRVTNYMATAHKSVLKQLADFKAGIIAWFTDVAPDLLDTDTKGSTDSIFMTEVLDPLPQEVRGEFILDDTAPSSHYFFQDASKSLSQSLHAAWKRESALLSTCLPRGIIVKSFADAMNLFSALIVGAAGTPYAHGLFLFDLMLPPDYPREPPKVRYLSFSTAQINPDIFVDGKLCLSLINTWSGAGEELWDPAISNLLQLLVSLQGVVLNSEPYFNDSNIEHTRGTPWANEKSREYNEYVVTNVVDSVVNMLERPPPLFQREIRQHFESRGDDYASLLEFWASLDSSEVARLKSTVASKNKDSKLSSGPGRELPDFPLAPVSQGFQQYIRRMRPIIQDLVASVKPGSLRQSS